MKLIIFLAICLIAVSGQRFLSKAMDDSDNVATYWGVLSGVADVVVNETNYMNSASFTINSLTNVSSNSTTTTWKLNLTFDMPWAAKYDTNYPFDFNLQWMF